MKLVIIEDDEHLSKIVKSCMELAGYECDSFSTAVDFFDRAKHGGFDLAIIDWSLPDASGLHILRWIRERLGDAIPVMFVTARDQEEDIVLALESGADDYMVKPVGLKELTARVQALLRRSVRDQGGPELVDYPPFRIDKANRRLTRNGEEIKLTQKEFDVVAMLFEHKGSIITRVMLLKKIWGTSEALKTRTIDTHISRIRNKLGLAGQYGWNLAAVYHHGYRLESGAGIDSGSP